MGYYYQHGAFNRPLASAGGQECQVIEVRVPLVRMVDVPIPETTRLAWQQAQHLVSHRVPIRPVRGELQPILEPISKRQSLHPVAYLRQNKGRWYSTSSNVNAAVRRFTTQVTSARGVKYDRASFPVSRTGTVVKGLSGRAPFASTLRPNLTGGTLGRTAGGYSLGSGRVGGARYFSHTPAVPAEIVQNVSHAIRAFCMSGTKAQYDGYNPHTGEKRFRAVSTFQKDTTRRMQLLPNASPGSYIDFHINPTITALTSLDSVTGYKSTTASTSQFGKTVNTGGLMDVLSADFSRALKDLTTVLQDLKRLTELGDMPITYTTSSSLRVHFPGCDAETVERLCAEIGVQRGTVTQDPDFDAFAGTEIALLFPFAPSRVSSEKELDHGSPIAHRREVIDWQRMLSVEDEDDVSTRSEDGFDAMVDEDCFSTPSGYESGEHSVSEAQAPESPLEYHDFEGICKFIELCDSSRR